MNLRRTSRRVDQAAESDVPPDEPAEEAQALPEREEPTDPTHGGTLRLALSITTDYWDPPHGMFGSTQFLHSLLYKYGIRWATSRTE